MVIFEAILVMLAAAMLMMMVARQLRLPYPVLLAIAGAVVAILPVEVAFDIDPQLVLALFVAPVLLDAAYDTSLRDLQRNWLPVASLALIAVGLTTAAVAVVVHILVPTIPWAAAIAIGAIVAPPDAVAATTVLRDVKLPHRITVVLEGEALLNDASTLVIYRLAVAAAVGGGSIGADAVAPAFLLSLVGSLVAGPAFAWIWGRLARRIEDMPSSVILQFVGTFGVWVGAEWLSLSPVLTVVAYGITLARMRAAYFPARLRLPSYAVWETSVVVLNVLAFLLIGLELAPVLASARSGELGALVHDRWRRASHRDRRKACLDMFCSCAASPGHRAGKRRAGRRRGTQLADRIGHRLGRVARDRHCGYGTRASRCISRTGNAAIRRIHGDVGYTRHPGIDLATARSGSSHWRCGRSSRS
jgi:NhaP-type Na+/H+ or K+/H+ antiporter